MMKSEKTVAYFYDEELGNYTYGGGNPMRPHRVRLTHSLVDNYGLTNKLLVHRPTPRTAEELTEFHADGARAPSAQRCAADPAPIVSSCSAWSASYACYGWQLRPR